MPSVRWPCGGGFRASAQTASQFAVPGGARGVLANRRRTADTPNLAAEGQSVSWNTVAEVPLTGLSFALDQMMRYPDHAYRP